MTIDVLPSGLTQATTSEADLKVLGIGYGHDNKFILSAPEDKPYSSLFDIIGDKISEEVRQRKIANITSSTGNVGIRGFMISDNAATLFVRNSGNTYMMQTGVSVDEAGAHNLNGNPLPISQSQIPTVITHLAALCRVDFAAVD